MNEDLNGHVSVVFGIAESDYLKVTILKREHPECNDYWDGNWLATNIELSIGGFIGKFKASLWTTDFYDFKEKLIKLYGELKGEAEFKTVEEQLFLKLKGDGLGHFEISGNSMDRVGIGNELIFKINIDQTQLPIIIKDLKNITELYPIWGQNS